jgi:[protein-PII] uridylyltransferase
LLYDVLFCLSRAQVNIALSRVATEKGAAFDSFYVTDMEGRKITDETRIRQLQSSLLAAATGGEYGKK